MALTAANLQVTKQEVESTCTEHIESVGCGEPCEPHQLVDNATLFDAVRRVHHILHRLAYKPMA